MCQAWTIWPIYFQYFEIIILQFSICRYWARVSPVRSGWGCLAWSKGGQAHYSRQIWVHIMWNADSSLNPRAFECTPLAGGGKKWTAVSTRHAPALLIYPSVCSSSENWLLACAAKCRHLARPKSRFQQKASSLPKQNPWASHTAFARRQNHSKHSELL